MVLAGCGSGSRSRVERRVHPELAYAVNDGSS
jgi:hypothetical protein